MNEIISGIAAIPTVSGGYFIDESAEKFELLLSVKKYSDKITKKTTYSWCEGGALTERSADVKFRSLSPNGTYLLVGKSSGEKERYIEIWSKYGTVFAKAIDVSSVHGEFCIDDVFGSFAWSPGETKFCYIADKKVKEAENSDSSYSKFFEIESFGERLQTVKEPVLCLFDLQNLKIDVVDFADENRANSTKKYPAQASFVDEEKVVLMGIDVGSKKLGMTYIYCRNTAIYELDLKSKNFDLISDPEFSSRSPIVSDDSSKICYLRNSLGLSHFKASQLVLYDCKTSKTEILIDIISDPKLGFPGIFCQQLPRQRFKNKIFFNSCWLDSRPIICYHLDGNRVERLIPEFNGSTRILEIRRTKILSVSSTPTNPAVLNIFEFSGEISKREVKLDFISNNDDLTRLDNDVESSIIEVSSFLHVVLMKPKGLKKIPLIIVPHGGPNSVYSFDYVLYPAIFAKMGYAVASINYTGSIGFGDASINALEGQIGIRDVEDCYTSLQYLLKTGEFDEKKVVVMGGSHGGYLTAFLSAKYPDQFIGAILRNPVTDLPSMTVTSDIADWTFGQLGIAIDQLKSRSMSAEELNLMFERSPSKYSKNVKCPTLVMLGAQDLRVPPSQGKYWVNLIKGNGVECQVLVFPDANHGLETADSERFGLEAILSFFQKIGF